MNWLRRAKEAWWQKQQATWIAEYAMKGESLRTALADTLEQLQMDTERQAATHKQERAKRLATLAVEEAELDALKVQVASRREELMSIDHDLRDRIRLLEAKAHPSIVWSSAFTSGFDKAWEMMLPLMTQGLHRMESTIRDQAIDETLKRLNRNGDTLHTG